MGWLMLQNVKRSISARRNSQQNIKRVCRDMNDTQTRKVLYCTLIRPRLEYCCNLWPPHTRSGLDRELQRRATKFILNYPHDCCYVNRLTSLTLLPLEYPREIHDLTLLFKLKSDLMNTDYTKFFTPATRYYNTRISGTSNFDVIATHRQLTLHRFLFFCANSKYLEQSSISPYELH